MSADLAQSQEQLGKALERAQLGEDRQLAQVVRDSGEILVRLLTGCLRMTRTHALNNRAFDKPVTEIGLALQRLVDLLGVVHLVAVEDQVYVNDIRIRMDDREGGGELGGELRRHRIGGISFHEALEDPQIRGLVIMLSEAPDPTGPRTAIRKKLQAQGAESIEVQPMFRFRVSGEGTEVAERDQGEIGERASGAVDEAWDNLNANRLPNPLPLRRAVTEMLEGGGGAEGLWDEPDGSTPFSAHAVRVTRLALLLGEELQLSEEALQDLGVAAMFHDVGYAAREGATKDEAGFAPPFERHASHGAALLLRQRGFHPSKIRRALGALESHMDFDQGAAGRPWLYGRILRICEDYDNFTRRQGPEGCPALVLGQMGQLAGKAYDPVILQALINKLGRFPPGTRLKIEGGFVVQVVSTARSRELWAKPIAVVIEGPTPNHKAIGRKVDLAVRGKVTGVIR